MGKIYGKKVCKSKVFYMVRHVEFSVALVMGISLYISYPWPQNSYKTLGSLSGSTSTVS